jgi:hypothetical protein
MYGFIVFLILKDEQLLLFVQLYRKLLMNAEEHPVIIHVGYENLIYAIETAKSSIFSARKSKY